MIIFITTDPGSTTLFYGLSLYFLKNGLKTICIYDPIIILEKKYFTKTIILQKSYLKKFDKIFSSSKLFVFGLSSKNYILCNYIHKIATEKKTPIFFYQDYWGFFGHFKQKINCTKFLVLDNYAKKLVRENKKFKKLSLEVIGSSKYFKYDENYQINKNKNLNVYFLQPVYLKSTLENFLIFINFFSKKKIDEKIYLKIHPLEKKENIIKIEKLISNYSFIYLINERKTNKILSNASVIYNSFSTVAFDAYLLNINKKLNIKIVNLLIGKNIINDIKKLGFNYKFLPQFKFGINIYNLNQLDDFFYKGIKKNIILKKLTYNDNHSKLFIQKADKLFKKLRII